MNTLLVPAVLLLLFAAPFIVSQTPADPPWQPWNDLPSHCSHIIVLRGEEDRRMADGIVFGENVRLVYPGPRALAATKEGLLRMTPMLCRSVRRIAFGLYTPDRGKTGAVNSWGAGDLVLINLAHERYSEESLELLSSRLMFQENLIHEAAHAAETLLGAESKDGGPRKNGKRYEGSWDLAARNLARRTIEKVRLEQGFYAEWMRLHRSFREHGRALTYDGPADAATVTRENKIPARWRGASHTNLAEAGFMNYYGAATWAEDIATFVGNVYLGAEMARGISDAGRSEDLRQDAACRELQSQNDENVPGRLAAVYSKLMFLLDVGFVREEDVDKCTGSNFGLVDVNGQGFHFFEKGDHKRSFLNKVEAGMGSKGVGNVFEMRGEGQASFAGRTYPASLKLSLAVGVGPFEKASWPRGLYKLGLVGPNKLSVRVDGAQAANFDAKDAFVLVGRSSAEYISGSVFLTQAWRPTAPIPVPQVFDPPLHIRFEMKK